MYLGVSPVVTSWSGANDEFSLMFDQNPLSEFVELPESCINLKYCNLMCGIIRGACEMVFLYRKISIVSDPQSNFINCRSNWKCPAGSFRTLSKAIRPPSFGSSSSRNWKMLFRPEKTNHFVQQSLPLPKLIQYTI